MKEKVTDWFDCVCSLALKVFGCLIRDVLLDDPSEGKGDGHGTLLPAWLSNIYLYCLTAF